MIVTSWDQHVEIGHLRISENGRFSLLTFRNHFDTTRKKIFPNFYNWRWQLTEKRYNFVLSIFAMFPRVSANQVYYSSSVKLSRSLQMPLPCYAENIRFVIKVRHSFPLVEVYEEGKCVWKVFKCIDTSFYPNNSIEIRTRSEWIKVSSSLKL